MKNKTFKGLEFLWFAILIVAFSLGIYETYKQGFGRSYPLFILAFIASLMYLLRRGIRKAREDKTNPK